MHVHNFRRHTEACEIVYPHLNTDLTNLPLYVFSPARGLVQTEFSVHYNVSLKDPRAACEDVHDFGMALCCGGLIHGVMSQ